MGITITDPQAASLLRALDNGATPASVLAMGEAMTASLSGAKAGRHGLLSNQIVFHPGVKNLNLSSSSFSINYSQTT